MSRIALIVGIDFYKHFYDGLRGCVKDAKSIHSLLEYNDDEQKSRNFDCKLLHAIRTDSLNGRKREDEFISREQLKDEVVELFSKKVEVALFYFAGHGYIDSSGGYILASDSKRGDDGLSLVELVGYANSSPATNKIIILDSCFSGFAGNVPNFEKHAAIADGVTILTASNSNESAKELVDGSHGVYTDLLIDALCGGAANLTGDITPGAVYAHIDQSLGRWQQRPVFKTNTESFISLRKIDPPIKIDELRKIGTLFPEKGFVYRLNPSFEPRDEGRTPEMPPADSDNTIIFSLLQKYNRMNLLVPVGVDHMWNAAMESKGCKLTLLGEHYRRLAISNRL